ncbi:GNAT family N-acetyltransferase [Actinoplanes sp. NBRC 101535]|uniref:GNAT family N-acetyltransferase n=1 Tax=Actinoplanes sp. NBRC 101535 TaxID=3032196 RepID=UPI002555F5BB|nr:GNAT family N-acetyltransferase [Actinoplanes sp. NBRC 101535]
MTTGGGSDALTADGGVVTIRPVVPADRPGLAALHGQASAANLRLRFFTQPSAATLAAEVDRLCRPESEQHLCLLAVENGEPVGVASAERIGTRPRAEFAVLIADRHHHRGIGTLLLEHLAARARHYGITELVGEVLAGNTGMLRVAHDLDPQTRTRTRQGVVDVTLQVGDDGPAQTSMELRDRTAERASLRALLTPSSIAVTGAGHRPGDIGRETVKSLLDHGFTGPVYAVNRTGEPVGRVPGRRHLRDLPGPVDLLVVAVPPGEVPTALADGAGSGARAAVILTPGLDGPGPAAHRRRTALVRLARSHGIRLVGPGSIGVYNSDPATRLAAGFAPVTPPRGDLGVATRSGAVAIAVLEHARRTGTGLSTLVTLGNALDVNEHDLVAYWHEDPATRVVALQAAPSGNPRALVRAVRALALRKPVLMLPAGPVPAPDVAEALSARTGMIIVSSLGELLDTARLLAGQPPPAGPRLALAGNDRGMTELAARTATRLGLRLDAVPGTTRSPRPDGPGGAGLLAHAGEIAAAAEDAASTGADMLLVLVAGTRGGRTAETLTALGCLADRRPGLPVAVAMAGGAGLPNRIGRRRIPVFETPEQAVRALAHAAGYAAWRREPVEATRSTPAGIDREMAHAVIGKALADRTGPQPDETTARLLRAYAIPFRPGDPSGAAGTRAPLNHGTGTLTAGITHDPVAGPLVTLGHGGSRVPRLAPLTDRDTARMRQAVPAGTAAPAALDDLLLRLGRLAEEHPEVTALDLGPVTTGPDGLLVTGAALHLAPPGAEGDPLLRHLPDPG